MHQSLNVPELNCSVARPAGALYFKITPRVTVKCATTAGALRGSLCWKACDNLLPTPQGPTQCVTTVSDKASVQG